MIRIVIKQSTEYAALNDSILADPAVTSDDIEPAMNHRRVSHRPSKQVTFKGGQDRLAHRWFRLTPSFSPHLVADVLEKYGTATSRVLDPFSGRGTTPIECQLRGVPCVGAEINPALHFAATVSLNWEVDADLLQAHASNVIERVRDLKKSLSASDPQQLETHLSLQIPTIHNVYRWWRPEVLGELMLIKYAISELSCEPPYKDALRLALTSILLDAANITLGRLQLHFVDRSAHHIDPLALFTSAASAMTDDMRELNARDGARSKIHLIDNRSLSSVIGDYRADLVITSPPYPNRYSYVWNTRPHLYFMEWFATASDASGLDCRTIGGTWGTATSRHQKGTYTYVYPEVEKTVGAIVGEIREKDLLMSNYVAMYFDDLYASIKETKKCLTDDAVCAYVVGNSRAKGSVVETDLLLAELFRHAGYSLMGIEEVRRRNSGKELHETIVFARNSP